MNDLFRKEAVESFKKQFVTDKRLSRISFSTLVMSALLIVGLKLFSIWFFKGVIINPINVEGVLYPSAGMEKVYALNSGTVTNVNVQPGDKVKMGDVLAVIPEDGILESLSYYSSSEETDDTAKTEREKYLRNSFVRSMADGTVVSVVQRGSIIQMGDAVALIAADDIDFDRDRVIVFVPTSSKSNIHIGDDVQISPDYAKREKYGYISGHVYELGTEIISRNEALENYNFYNIPNMLDENTTYITVTIVLDENENYESGLAWSHASSSTISPELGTHCSCSIISDRQTPFEWLFGGGGK